MEEVPMHTMIVCMTLDPAQPGEVERHFREDVRPWARAQPGFLHGCWLRSDDGRSGRGLVTFASARDAQQAAAGPRAAPPGPAWSVDSVEIFEQVDEDAPRRT
jgi:hypothetical protein